MVLKITLMIKWSVMSSMAHASIPSYSGVSQFNASPGKKLGDPISIKNWM
jgi:hypothetical protein